jgi:hypothetical protein
MGKRVRLCQTGSEAPASRGTDALGVLLVSAAIVVGCGATSDDVRGSEHPSGGSSATTGGTGGTTSGEGGAAGEEGAGAPATIEGGSSGSGGSRASGGTADAGGIGIGGESAMGGSAGGSDGDACDSPTPCTSVTAACLGLADETPLMPSTSLSFQATIQSVSMEPSGPGFGSCVGYPTGEHLRIELEDESEVGWVLQVQGGGVDASLFEQGNAVTVGYRDAIPFPPFGTKRLISIHEGDSLAWFTMVGETPEAFEVPGFGIALAAEPLGCMHNACSLVDVHATASDSGVTVEDACGEDIGDFVLYQRYQVNPGSGVGGCDGGAAHRTSAVRSR